MATMKMLRASEKGRRNEEIVLAAEELAKKEKKPANQCLAKEAVIHAAINNPPELPKTNPFPAAIEKLKNVNKKRKAGTKEEHK